MNGLCINLYTVLILKKLKVENRYKKSLKKDTNIK